MKNTAFNEDDIAALLEEVEALRDREKGYQMVIDSQERAIGHWKERAQSLEAQLNEIRGAGQTLVNRLTEQS